ncbi:unnamed protein product [Penicillium glandicola]
MTRYPDIPDSDSPDVECFEALPDDTFEAIGSLTDTIRRIIKEQQEPPIDVIKYLCFTNVPVRVAEKANVKVSRSLNSAVLNAVYDMRLHQSIYPVGSQGVRGISSSKQPDESWVPTQYIPGRDEKWPTVTAEVGVADSYRKLRADAEWWLTNSKGDVKLVIIVSINRKTPNIRFEAVVLDPAISSHQGYIPTIRQSITTFRQPTQPNARITVRPAVALTIKFQDLFCYRPVPPEHNIEISPDQLANISSDVWMRQGL